MSSPVHDGFRSVPPFAGNLTVLWAVTVLMGVVCVALLVLALLKWRQDRSPVLPWLLLGALPCPFLAEPILDIISGLYLPKEAPLQMFTVLGRPMPVGDLLMYVFGALFTYFMYDMILRGRSVRYIWGIGAVFAIIELFAADLFLVRGNAMLYYHNPVAILGEPIYVPIQYASMIITGAVITTVIVPHLRGARWAWMLLAIPLGLVGQVMITGTPVYIAIHSDYPAVVNWGLALLTCLLSWALAQGGLYLEQVERLRRQPAIPLATTSKHSGAANYLASGA